MDILLSRDVIKQYSITKYEYFYQTRVLRYTRIKVQFVTVITYRLHI